VWAAVTPQSYRPPTSATSAPPIPAYETRSNGPYDPAGSTYEGEVVDGQLLFTGPARFRYELDADGKIKVSADGTLEKDWELRNAEGTWKPWMSNTYTRGAQAGASA
jgi:hypothetical protein